MSPLATDPDPAPLTYYNKQKLSNLCMFIRLFNGDESVAMVILLIRVPLSYILM
jgi:hypothetical protein